MVWSELDLVGLVGHVIGRSGLESSGFYFESRRELVFISRLDLLLCEISKVKFNIRLVTVLSTIKYRGRHRN